jgi:quercetin dioxygenase-like cupin family protein
MPSHRFTRVLLVLAVLAAAVASATVYGAGLLRAAAPKPVLRLELAASNNPIGSKGRTLGLSKVIIPAHTQLALHHHPGTQVAFVASGTLTYTVESGSVAVMKGAAASGAAKTMLRITAGKTGVIHAGEWIVEEPSTIHSGANRTSKPVIVYLATLFPIGSPAAVPNQ